MSDDLAADAPPRGGCAHLLAVHVLLFASITGTLALTLVVLCALARAWSLALGAGAIVVVAAASSVLAWSRRLRPRRVALAALAAALATGVALVAPWPLRSTRALTRAVTIDGADAGAPWFGGIPELHLVRFGAWLDTRGTEREWLERGLFDDAYARVAAGDVVDPRRSYTLDAWLLDRGHVWLAEPDGPGPFPLLVFLHGNGGPFQFYPQVLAQAAVERGVVVAMPTWGFGWWTTEAGRRRALETIDVAARLAPIDPTRVVIGGLSAGGVGAVDLFAREPTRFAACVAISGAPESVTAGDPTFGGRPLLLIHGVGDRRVPVTRVRALAETTRSRGGRVDLIEVEDGDHFLVLTHEREVTDRCLEVARPAATERGPPRGR